MASPDGTKGNSSRWNPTQEQISMLESLYMQGIRTPNADQIEQITSGLKVYGNIEGKNVFYWFQNHKARQRQKQKRDNMAYFNRYLQRTTQPAAYPPLGPNVVCAPYFLAQGDLGFHPQYPNVVLPTAGFKVRARSEQEMEKTSFYGVSGYDQFLKEYSTTHTITKGSCWGEGTLDINKSGIMGSDHHETLPLFPLQPSNGTVTSLGSTWAENSTSPSCSSETTAGIDREPCVEKPFFDFFSGQGSCQSG